MLSRMSDGSRLRITNATPQEEQVKDHEEKFETDPKTLKRTRFKKILRCSICPPNRGENASRKPKHGAQKRKSKNKRRA